MRGMLKEMSEVGEECRVRFYSMCAGQFLVSGDQGMKSSDIPVRLKDPSGCCENKKGSKETSYGFVQ